MFKKVIYVLSIATILSACNTNDKDIVTVTTPVLFPAYLADNCSVPKPPSKKNYLNYSHSEKEAAWAEAMAGHYSSERNCNTKLESLRKWRKEQLKIYNIEEE